MTTPTDIEARVRAIAQGAAEACDKYGMTVAFRHDVIKANEATILRAIRGEGGAGQSEQRTGVVSL